MGSEKGPENRASVCLGAEAFARAGGRVVLGSDPYARSEGRVPGLADHDTIKKVVTFGFSPLETIRMATLDGSTFLGIQDRTGTIAVGKEAERTESHTTPSCFSLVSGPWQVRGEQRHSTSKRAITRSNPFDAP
jgi:hypothetical protein